MNSSILKRTIQNIRRSSWRAYAVVFMMTVTFIILGLLMTLIYGTQRLAVYFEQKPEVIGFFKQEVTEEQILEVKRELESFDYVAEVAYVSKDQAMEAFMEENIDNPDILSSVTVNVFPAHLNVKSISLENIPEVANYFRTNDLIEDVLASENILETLGKVVLGIQIFGLSLLTVFTISTIFIIFLTVGITVYSHKEELIVMKLVGAGNWYIRAPYLAQSLIYALLGVFFASLLLLPLLLAQYKNIMSGLLGDLNVVDLDVFSLSVGTGIMVIFAILLAAFSSYFATRRYINN